MFDQRQREAALKILEQRKVQKQQQCFAFLGGTVARLKMEETLLPYRVLYDIEVAQRKNELKEIPPNKYYPSNGMPVNLEFMATSLMPGNEEQRLQQENDPEYQEKRLEFLVLEKSARTPNEKWEYYYAHFLKDYDFSLFKPFDFTGRADSAEEDVKDMRAFLMKVQSSYLADPKQYFSGMPLKQSL